MVQIHLNSTISNRHPWYAKGLDPAIATDSAMEQLSGGAIGSNQGLIWFGAGNHHQLPIPISNSEAVVIPLSRMPILRHCIHITFTEDV
jgi:hypothetical protein